GGTQIAHENRVLLGYLDFAMGPLNVEIVQTDVGVFLGAADDNDSLLGQQENLFPVGPVDDEELPGHDGLSGVKAGGAEEWRVEGQYLWSRGENQERSAAECG